MQNYKLQTKDTNKTLFAGFFKDYKTCLEEAVRRRIPLHSINLKNKNLSNANLDDGVFSSADFHGTNLTGANMSECYLNGANFQNASLFNTCFAYSNLSNANFQDASFGATDMAGCIIDNSQFSTLSTFTIDFTKIRQMHDCIFITRNGAISKLSTPPIVISGIGKSPIIMLDEHIFEGHHRIESKQSKRLLEVIANLHNQASTPPTIKKYGKIT